MSDLLVETHTEKRTSSDKVRLVMDRGRVNYHVQQASSHQAVYKILHGDFNELSLSQNWVKTSENRNF